MSWHALRIVLLLVALCTATPLAQSAPDSSSSSSDDGSSSGTTSEIIPAAQCLCRVPAPCQALDSAACFQLVGGHCSPGSQVCIDLEGSLSDGTVQLHAHRNSQLFGVTHSCCALVTTGDNVPPWLLPFAPSVSSVAGTSLTLGLAIDKVSHTHTHT